MTVTAVVAYLGIVLAGCAVVGIADSFAPAEIASRLRISKAAAIITQDVIMRGGKRHPLYQRVTKASAVRAIVVPASAVKGLQASDQPVKRRGRRSFTMMGRIRSIVSRSCLCQKACMCASIC